MTIYEAAQDEEILGIAGVEGPSPLTILDVARKESSGSSGREREMILTLQGAVVARTFPHEPGSEFYSLLWPSRIVYAGMG